MARHSEIFDDGKGQSVFKIESQREPNSTKLKRCFQIIHIPTKWKAVFFKRFFFVQKNCAFWGFCCLVRGLKFPFLCKSDPHIGISLT